MVKKVLQSRLFHTLAGVGVSAVLLGWMFFEIKWDEVGEQLARMHYWVMIPATIVLAVHFLLRSWRWRYLLPADGESSLRARWESIFLGNFATYILPLRAGEFVRPFYLTRHSRYPFSVAFASVVIERFFDLAMVLFSFGWVVWRVEGLPPWVYQGAFSLAILAVAIFLFMLLGAFAPGPLRSLMEATIGRLPQKIARPLISFASGLLDGVAVIRDWKRFVMTAVLTVVVWLSCFAQFYVYFFLFDIPPSWLMAVTTGVVIALAVAAPSAPGFIGVYQIASIAAFSLFGISKDIAAAFSIVTHVHLYVIFVAYGPYLLLKSNLKLTDLRRPAPLTT